MALIFSIYNDKITPGADNTSDLGSSSLQWRDLYLTGTAYIDSIGESILFADNITFTFGTGTGIKLGVTTNTKIGFFNATPVAQQANTTDLRTLLINFGFLATGGANPLNLNGGTLTTGSASVGQLTLADGSNIVMGTGTGHKVGTGTNQKLAFYNGTPAVQPSTTGETVGFTAGAGTNVTDQSTFTGNVGTTAYRISDIVKHLKNLGLIAS